MLRLLLCRLPIPTMGKRPCVIEVISRRRWRRCTEMNLTIDNLQGLGPQDYTRGLDGKVPPTVGRKLNRPAELQFSLVANVTGLVVPVTGARVILSRADGSFVFTGYVTGAPEYEYLGWGGQGPVYRYNVVAQSDELLLDQKTLPNRAPFVGRSAGDAIQQLAE